MKKGDRGWKCTTHEDYHGDKPPTRLSCKGCLETRINYLESIAPADNMQQVERYGKMVWENQEFEAMRKENCMCLTCGKLKPGKSTNCGIARQFYKICVEHGCAFILTRCEDWEDKYE